MDKDIEALVEELQEKIREIEDHKVMKAAAKMIERKERYQAAIRALLKTGNKVTGEGGNRVTQAEVVAWFKRNPGDWEVAEIAAGMGYPDSTIRGHLNRGRGERFIQHEDKTWSLREPKNEAQDEEDE